jgi:hypothetical protein
MVCHYPQQSVRLRLKANLQIYSNTQLRAMHIDFWNTTYISLFIVKGKEPTRCDKICSFIASIRFGHQLAHHQEYN